MRIPLLLGSAWPFAQKKENVDDVFVALRDDQQLETSRDLFFCHYLFIPCNVQFFKQERFVDEFNLLATFEIIKF